MPSTNYTPLEVRSLHDGMVFDFHVVSPVQREAAARAIIRSRQHKREMDNWDSTRGRLHSAFFKLNDLNIAPDERESILQMTWEDICDAAKTIDQGDGGTTLVARCRGFTVDEPLKLSDITIDTYFTPHLAESRVLNERMASIIQDLGEQVIMPSLQAFTTRCHRHSGIYDVSPPRSGTSISRGCLPAPEPGTTCYFRCRCFDSIETKGTDRLIRFCEDKSYRFGETGEIKMATSKVSSRVCSCLTVIISFVVGVISGIVVLAFS